MPFLLIVDGKQKWTPLYIPYGVDTLVAHSFENATPSCHPVGGNPSPNSCLLDQTGCSQTD